MIAPEGKAGRFPADCAGKVESALDEIFAKYSFAFAYGSMASGADILFAERIIKAGAQLHVVLPFDIETFIAGSVSPAGGDWPDRCRAAIKRAATLEILPEPADAAVSVYAQVTDYAMEHVIAAAKTNGIKPIQIAVWDGVVGDAKAGTWHDIQTWQDLGETTIIVASKTGHIRQVTGAKLASPEK
jgi:hypothetical protein